MYINNIHIIAYVLIGIAGLFTGFWAGWCNKRMPEEKPVLTKDILLEYRTSLKPNYFLMVLNSAIYVFLLYKMGVQYTLVGNLPLISYLILTPMLLSVFCIDYKHTIIPNRLNLTMFEVGLAFVFLYGLVNFNKSLDLLSGMAVGALIFLAISLLGRLIAGKEAMGFGDVKLMGALGIFFGLSGIIIITVLAFLIGAIVSILIMIIKRKTDQYIPFGPFIVIATFITMLVSNQELTSLLIKIFTLGLAK